MLKKRELPFTSVLVLAAREGEAATDRTELRRNGIRHVRIMQSGIEAARLLDQQVSQKAQSPDGMPPFDLVICDESLVDLRGVEFMNILRRHPQLKEMPVVLVSRSATRSVVLEAINAGCAGYLVRPYTPEAFAQQIVRAGRIGVCSPLAEALANGKEQLCRQAFEDAIGAFTVVVEEAEPAADDFYAQGNGCLQNRDWDGAIVAFNKAVRMNVLYAEAYLGLASAWRGKGDERKYHWYLKMAGEAYTRLEQFHNARNVFEELMVLKPEAKNPLYGVASSLLKLGKYEAAAKAYIEASKLSPDEEMHTHVARACHFTSKPEKTAMALCAAMEKVGGAMAAKRLYRRIVALPERSRVVHEPKTWLHRFPRVREAVSVAKYTIDMYKELEA